MTLPTSITAGPRVNLNHHRIHEGNFFSTHTISSGLMIANPKRFLFISPSMAPPPFASDTIKIHLIFVVSTNPGVKLEFFEDTVVSDNGIAIPIINQNRLSPTPPVGQVFQDPITIAEETLIFSQIVGSTTEGGTGGLVDRDEQEFILKIGTNYLLKITPLVDNTDITTHFKGYDARPSSPVPIPPLGL
jgi:hypothetical protein